MKSLLQITGIVWILTGLMPTAQALTLQEMEAFLRGEAPLPEDCGSLLQVTPVRFAGYPKHSVHFRGIQRITEIHLDGPPGATLENRVPHAARERTGVIGRSSKGLAEFGPNCLNATLLWFGMTCESKFTLPHTFSSLLSTHFSLVGKDEPLDQDDVIVLKGNDPIDGRIPIHSAILFGRETNDLVVWHKASRLSSDPWTFERITEMFKFYRARSDVEFLAYRRKPGF